MKVCFPVAPEAIESRSAPGQGKTNAAHPAGNPGLGEIVKNFAPFSGGSRNLFMPGGRGRDELVALPGVEEVKIWVALALLVKYHG